MRGDRDAPFLGASSPRLGHRESPDAIQVSLRRALWVAYRAASLAGACVAPPPTNLISDTSTNEYHCAAGAPRASSRRRREGRRDIAAVPPAVVHVHGAESACGFATQSPGIIPECPAFFLLVLCSSSRRLLRSLFVRSPIIARRTPARRVPLHRVLRRMAGLVFLFGFSGRWRALAKGMAWAGLSPPAHWDGGMPGRAGGRMPGRITKK